MELKAQTQVYCIWKASMITTYSISECAHKKISISLRWPGMEPRANAWKAFMLPLHHQRMYWHMYITITQIILSQTMPWNNRLPHQQVYRGVASVRYHSPWRSAVILTLEVVQVATPNHNQGCTKCNNSWYKQNVQDWNEMKINNTRLLIGYVQRHFMCWFLILMPSFIFSCQTYLKTDMSDATHGVTLYHLLLLLHPIKSVLDRFKTGKYTSFLWNENLSHTCQNKIVLFI